MSGWALAAAVAGESAPLEGMWDFRLDPQNVGLREKWFERLPAPAKNAVKSIRLPGTTDEARAGLPNPKPPNLDGLYRSNQYAGPAWYAREIEIPAAWKGKVVSLSLERVHWVTQVWLDGKPLGAQDSLIAPHVYDLRFDATPGRHRLTLRIDNTKKIDLGGFTSIYYEGTQTNWNGVVGRIELAAHDPLWIESQQVYPKNDGTVRVELSFRNERFDRIHVNTDITISEKSTGKVVGRWGGGIKVREGLTDDQRRTLCAHLTKTALMRLDTPPKLWSEFSPDLYVVKTEIRTQSQPAMSDTAETTFGFRELAVRGTQFTMNGRPLLLRGTLECGIFPLTGHPPTDVPAWQRIYQIMKSYGLNFIRFHSWCPPEAAFAAADLEGVMIQAEGPQANIDAGSDPARDAFIEQEFQRMVRTYGNHPSFCLMTLGNEYGGKDSLLSRWIDMLIKEDPRHLYSSPSAGQTTANRQYTEGGPRGIHGPGTDADFRDAVAQQDRPLMGHEIGQWTFYPDFQEIKKYSGVLRARNFEIVRNDLARKGMLDLAPRFLQATGQHAVLLYKEEIEVLLRTPGHAGFSLLDLHDYPGQGTALIGPLDPFWDSKGFVAPETHRQYCGPTVPLLRMPKRAYTADESFWAAVEIAHFGPHDLARVRPWWTIKDQQGRLVAEGTLPMVNIPTGKLTPLGSIRAALAKAAAPAKLTVTVAAGCANQWDIWVYPSKVSTEPPPGVLVTHDWDDATRAALAAGKRVLLFPRLKNLSHSLRGQFLPVFWSPIWFPTQQPNTMGILCDPAHPALARFPTEFYSNWQWYDLIEHSRSLILDETPAQFRPIVAVIDNFSRNHKLGNLLEARVGPGRLLVCAIDLAGPLEHRPAARQLRSSLYAYAGSEKFQPAQELDRAALDMILAPAVAGIMEKLGARVIHTDSEQADYKAANAIDGDPGTFWHTEYGAKEPGFPHELVIEFPQPVAMRGCKLLPRQDGNANGWIKGFEIYTCSDGTRWGDPVAKGVLVANDQVKIVKFPLVKAKYLRLVALSTFNQNNRFASLAELEVVP
jgi:hypothetical protein